MAEGFARKYGLDVLEPYSGGLAPAVAVPPKTCAVMAERNIDISQHFPKDFRHFDLSQFQLVVNLSGMPLPGRKLAPVREWKVADPIGGSDADYREAADLIETQVMNLIVELRRTQNASSVRQNS